MSYCSRQLLIPIALCLLFAGFPRGIVAQTQRLTDDGTMKFTPTFFRNDNELAFVQFVKPTLFQIMCLKLDDLSVQPLAKSPASCGVFFILQNLRAYGRISVRTPILPWRRNRWLTGLRQLCVSLWDGVRAASPRCPSKYRYFRQMAA